MPSVTVTTEDGKDVVVVGHNVAYIEHVPGEPGEPAVEAQDEVPDDPGEEANLQLGNPGRAPRKGRPAIKAKAAKEGKPDKAVIHFVGGDTLNVAMSAKSLRDAIG